MTRPVMRMLLAVLAVVGLATAGCAKRASSTPSTDDGVAGWNAVGIGSVFETKTVTRLERPFIHETETTTKQTLVATTATGASVKLELTSETSGTSSQVVNVPLDAAPQACADSTVTTSQETCTVPAGTFDCTRTSVAVRQGDVTRSTVTWTAKAIPVPIKSVVTNENMTTTTELTSLTLK